MRAFVITAAGHGAVEDVDPPVAGPGQVVVDVDRVGVCGTDVELFSGTMEYLRQGHTTYPLRIGHEWCGRVAAVGTDVDPAWLGRRVTADTMLGCGSCERCRSGRQHLCANRYEIGIRGDWPGALAEQVLVPATALHPLPDTIDAVAGALVEPGGSAMRAVAAAAVQPGSRALVWGPGTIGLLTALFATAAGAQVHVVGQDEPSLTFARSVGVHHTWTAETLPPLPFDAVIDATDSPEVPAAALDRVEPGRRVVYVGLAARPSVVDTRSLVLKDLTAVGILSASPGLRDTIEHYATGRVDPRPLVAATVGLDQVADVLAGRRPTDAAAGPKIHVDPRR